MKNTKRTMFTSVVSLVLCFAMFLGTTFAWFTDVVTSSGNIIKSGNLDLDLMKGTKVGDNWVWESTEGKAIFDYDKWEPGYTSTAVLAVENHGSLRAKWTAKLTINGTPSILADVIDIYVTSYHNYSTDRPDFNDGTWQKLGSVSDVVNNNGLLLPGEVIEPGHRQPILVALHMRTDAGNEYQEKSLGANFDITILATQATGEYDSFDDQYDADAEWPEIPSVGNSASADVSTDENGVVTTEITINGEGMSATVPAGVQLTQGTSNLTLSIRDVENSEANVTLAEGEELRSLDVHIDGIADGNTTPIAVTLTEALPKGLNLGNYTLHHVEDGVTESMTALADGETPAHNTFTYDPATGDVTLYMASFSEVALVSNTDNAWNGNVDKDLKGDGTASNPYIIATADELAGMSQLVSDSDNHASAHYRLVANVNFGGYENYWVNGVIDVTQIKERVFYPIGYWAKQDGTNAAGETYYDYGNGFSGVFDGNGNTVSGICQRTWDMDGNYDYGYWDAAMGLFGYVNGGTVKNLTIRDFESDGEFTPTGCVAAYARAATFENIALVNCNPRVYNTGNGGIVGILGLSDDENVVENTTTFKNITVDNTNTISALWGTWDGCCGGIAGMYRGRGPVYLENCHVGAKIDVYNDVCGNYQYYWYRYSGMLIAAIRTETTDGNGYTIPDTSTITAKNCTVHFGDWNDYYYCELVANSLASYTHDHQFSRLTEIASLDEIKSGDIWLKTGNFLLIEGDTKTCYHIVNDNGVLRQHLHTDAGYEDGIDEDRNGQPDLKEDKQIVYLPFNQLFQGWGWGVKNIPVYNGSDYAFAGVTILDRTEANSVEKFEGRIFNSVTNNGILIKEGILASPVSGRHYKLSHIFNYLEGSGVPVVSGALTVTVTNLEENGNVTATLNRDLQNWEDSTLTFSGKGRIRLTIQDYYYCTPTSIEIEVREYPEGSKILNFTYDGFENREDHDFSTVGDHITNGKHGTYECDFGFGPEILDYAHKFDTSGKIVFTAPADGLYTIAYASQNANAGIRYTINGGSYITLDIIHDPYELHIAQLQMEKGKTYEFTRLNKESGIYYVGFVPTNSIEALDHTEHIFYDDTTATCTESGKLTEMCLVCGKTQVTNNAPALGHDYVNEPGYPSTCEQTGKKPGVYCARCNEVQSGCESIPAHGHNYENGFCHCSAEACHMPEDGSIENIIAGVDFTKGNTNNFSDSFFKPNGNYGMSNDNKYLTMKSYTTLDNPTVFQHSYIEFTVDQAVTFYVRVASTDRGNISKFALMNANGEYVKTLFHDTNEVEVTGVSGHTLVYTLEAGTYRFYCTSTDRAGRVMNMVVSTDVVKVNNTEN